MVADMKIDPRLEMFSIWGKPIFTDGFVFPLPKLPERKVREVEKGKPQSGKSGSSTKLLETRNGKSEVGKGKGKEKEESRGARRDGYAFDKYRELPSVAAHRPWCARNDARAENGDPGERNGFDRYRELPSVVAHGAWCARISTGDGGERENEDRRDGYKFERYSELPSVVAHWAWCARNEDGDRHDEEIEEEDNEE